MIIKEYSILFYSERKITLNKTGTVPRAIFLKWLREYDASVSETLHDENKMKIYSVSNISLVSKHTYKMTFYIRASPLSAIYDKILPQKNTIQINRMECPIIEKKIAELPIPTTFGKVEKETYIQLNILTPIIFSSNSKKYKVDPLMNHVKIWGNLLRTWETLGGELEENYTDAFIQALRTNLNCYNYNIRTVKCYIKQNNYTIGVVGKITFFIEQSENLDGIIELTRLGEIWGIGSKRSRGFGRIQLKIYKKN